MIRFIHCMKRRPELSVAEFREYWNSQEFNDLTNKIVELLGAVSVMHNLTFNIELNNELMKERGSEEPYDGIIEVWFENAADLDKLDTEAAEKIFAEMTTYQSQFTDFHASKRFFTEWEPTAGLG